MRKEQLLALYNHGVCGSMFFAEIDNTKRACYTGTCPNPDCNKPVELSPKTLFHSLDKARRDYIKRTRNGDRIVFWRA